MDALLLTGGGDISLRFLRQRVAMPSLIVDTDCARDKWEFNAVAEMLLAGKADSCYLPRIAGSECRDGWDLTH